ncbi:unnamed protein product [Caenorhabditis angaria]|uniref:Uncharacterized protein n=1 Tax=Caenorhabditis angaria TaxID=860376 RepID=A0A9P1MU63_9PELO|nr:unnamed protein product [Caenorhabditis angaria]
MHSSGRYQSKAGPSHSQDFLEDEEEDEEDEQHYTRFHHPQQHQENISTDDAITILLSSLRFETHRQQIPEDRDDDQLRRCHEKIFTQIQREPDDQKRRRLKKALPAANCVREQIYYLRRRPGSPSPSYFHRLSAQLDAIVKDSFEEEYRKVAIILGLVEALAEVLILELAVFGVPQVNCDEHRTIRKLIANALTNLTYGQIHSKRRLCSYSGFVPTMIRIIIESTNLTQVYAGLVRNLSWMADGEMSEALRPTVHALSIAAVRAANKNREDFGCVKATLSALWNLASHSIENKKTICETPNCLAILANLLSTDVRQTAIVDSATGILKYVSQHLANTSSHLELRPILLTRLVALLGSSSFTIVTNTLGAIANLISKDPHLQNALRHDVSAIQQLNILRNSNRDDIRSAVKNVLNAVNQPGNSYPAASAEMSCSLTISPRMLPLRATMASPGRFAVAAGDSRSCSLPRGFGKMQQSLAPSYQHSHQQHSAIPPPPPLSNATVPLDDSMLDIQSSTAMGTRSNSIRSLGSVDPGSIIMDRNSTIDTAANSSRALSPVSFSDLPASPTMCAAILAEQQTPVFQNNLIFGPGAGGGSTTVSGTSTAQNTMTTSLGAAHGAPSDSSPDEELPGPSFRPGPGPEDGDLLERSIQKEMPKIVSPRLNGFFSPNQQRRQVSPHLLMESIMSEMPKNVEADHQETENEQHNEPTGEQQLGEKMLAQKIGSQSLESQEYTTSEEEDSEEDDDFQPEKPRHNQDSQTFPIPQDCYDEEEEDFYGEETDFEEDLNATQFEGDVTIDCREFRETSTPKGSVTQILRGGAQKTRLPVPSRINLNRSVVKSPQFITHSKIARPRLPPKPKTLLLTSKVSPFYHENAENQGEEEAENENDQTIYVNAPENIAHIMENEQKMEKQKEKQMLVTTV